MNIHEKVERLTKELDDQYKLLNEIKQQLEPEITEGQYVFIDGFQELHRVVEFDSVDNTYGVVPISDKDNGSWEKRHSLRIASDDEVEQALIKEAKRRGFDEINGKFKCLYSGLEIHCRDHNNFTYSGETDSLSLGSCCIYKQGEFAEIIEDEWEVEATNVYMSWRVVNGDRVIESSKYLRKDEAQAIANALNNLGND